MLPAFRVPVRTRGYECDPTRTVPIPVLLSYLEHCRWETMQDPVLGVLDHVHQGHFFVVLEQTLEVVRRVGMGHDLVALAVLEQVGRSSGWVRHALVRESDGALVAHARVRGAWMGPTRRLARIPDRMREVCTEQAEALAQLPAPDTAEGAMGGLDDSWFEPPEVTHASLGLDVAPPAEVRGDAVHQRLVQPSDIDIFDHVNAVTYLRYFDDARAELGLDAPLQRVSLRYVQQAFAGDTLTVRAHVRDPRHLEVAIERDEEVLCLARLDLARTRTEA